MIALGITKEILKSSDSKIFLRVINSTFIKTIASLSLILRDSTFEEANDAFHSPYLGSSLVQKLAEIRRYVVKESNLSEL